MPDDKPTEVVHVVRLADPPDADAIARLVAMEVDAALRPIMARLAAVELELQVLRERVG